MTRKGANVVGRISSGDENFWESVYSKGTRILIQILESAHSWINVNYFFVLTHTIVCSMLLCITYDILFTWHFTLYLKIWNKAQWYCIFVTSHVKLTIAKTRSKLIPKFVKFIIQHKFYSFVLQKSIQKQNFWN